MLICALSPLSASIARRNHSSIHLCGASFPCAHPPVRSSARLHLHFSPHCYLLVPCLIFFIFSSYRITFSAPIARLSLCIAIPILRPPLVSSDPPCIGRVHLYDTQPALRGPLLVWPPDPYKQGRLLSGCDKEGCLVIPFSAGMAIEAGYRRDCTARSNRYRVSNQTTSSPMYSLDAS